MKILPVVTPYPVYSEAEKEARLLAVIKYVLSIPESRLRQPESQEKEEIQNE